MRMEGTGLLLEHQEASMSAAPPTLPSLTSPSVPLGSQGVPRSVLLGGPEIAAPSYTCRPRRCSHTWLPLSPQASS